MANYFGNTAFATEDQRQIARRVLSLLVTGDIESAATLLDAHARPGDDAVKAFSKTAMSLRNAMVKAADLMADLIATTAAVKTIEIGPGKPVKEIAPPPPPATEAKGTETDAHKPATARKPRTRKPAAKAS